MNDGNTTRRHYVNLHRRRWLKTGGHEVAIFRQSTWVLKMSILAPKSSSNRHSRPQILYSWQINFPTRKFTDRLKFRRGDCPLPPATCHDGTVKLLTIHETVVAISNERQLLLRHCRIKWHRLSPVHTHRFVGRPTCRPTNRCVCEQGFRHTRLVTRQRGAIAVFRPRHRTCRIFQRLPSFVGQNVLVEEIKVSPLWPLQWLNWAEA